MNKKIAVWVFEKEDETKEYIYASSHKEAARKYSKKHDVAMNVIETRKA